MAQKSARLFDDRAAAGGRKRRKPRSLESELQAAQRVAAALSSGWARGRTGRTGRRTYVASVKAIGRQTGGVRKLVAGLDYNAREGKNARRLDELELKGGLDTKTMTSVIEAADRATSRANGSYGISAIIELPLTDGASPLTSKPMREDVARNIAKWFEDRGCPTHWAIHSHNDDGAFQPHLHLTTTRRPVRQVDGEWIGEDAGARGRAGTRGHFQTRAELRAWRRHVAMIVNTAAELRGLQIIGGEWDGGNFTDVDHERAPQGRISVKAKKALEPRPERAQRESDIYTPEGSAKILAERKAWGEAKRAEAEEKAVEKAQAAAQRAKARAEEAAERARIASARQATLKDQKRTSPRGQNRAAAGVDRS